MEDAVVTSQLGSGSTPLFSALAISRQIRVPHPHKDGAGTYGYSSPSTHPSTGSTLCHTQEMCFAYQTAAWLFSEVGWALPLQLHLLGYFQLLCSVKPLHPSKEVLLDGLHHQG